MVYDNFVVKRAMFVDRIKNGEDVNDRVSKLQQYIDYGVLTEEEYEQVRELYMKEINDIQVMIDIKELQQQRYKNRKQSIYKNLPNIDC